MCAQCGYGNVAIQPAPIFLSTPSPSDCALVTLTSAWLCVPTNQLIPPPPPPPPPGAKKEEIPVKTEKTGKTQRRVKRSEAKKYNKTNLPVGTGYIHSKRTTSLHVIKDVKVWESGTNPDWAFDRNKAALSMGVGELLEVLTEKDGDECQGWAMTEVLEIGNGVFDKVK